MVLHLIPGKVWRTSSNCGFWIADVHKRECLTDKRRKVPPTPNQAIMNARIVSGRSQLLLAKAIIRVTVRRLKPILPLATK